MQSNAIAKQYLGYISNAIQAKQHPSNLRRDKIFAT